MGGRSAVEVEAFSLARVCRVCEENPEAANPIHRYLTNGGQKAHCHGGVECGASFVQDASTYVAGLPTVAGYSPFNTRHQRLPYLPFAL